MSRPPHPSIPDRATETPGDGRLYVVRAADRVDHDVAGHHGCRYESPAHTLSDALTLASLLLGGPVDASPANGRWTRPIPGGQRTVTLERAADAFQQ